MPARRKPTALLEASGAFRKNPQRRAARANEPIPNGPLGDPPAWLNKTAVECWHNLAARIPYPLTNADEHILAFTSMLEARIRRGGATAGEISLYAKCLSKLGMTPSDRSLVQVPTSKTRNEFADC
jgi:hypothetical protein